jgi:predicted O-methyltransferase YrrM
MVIEALRNRLGPVRRRRREWRAFADVDTIGCDARRLTRNVTARRVSQAFRSAQIDEEWRAIESDLLGMGITEKAGGVNPGDRRAIYYLVRHFEPRKVLEVGTHIGASTVHIAAALRRVQEEDPEGTYKMTTVDIADVNDPATRPWLEYGSVYSPAEMAERLGLQNQISFVTAGSLDYFASCEEQYDFIFLDGDHAPSTVYQEIPIALQALCSEGVILLHDYFPELRPLWSNRTVIRGPWLATERLRAEGAQFEVLPLGDLPWATKLGSRTTSLALLVGTE